MLGTGVDIKNQRWTNESTEHGGHMFDADTEEQMRWFSITEPLAAPSGIPHCSRKSLQQGWCHWHNAIHNASRDLFRVIKTRVTGYALDLLEDLTPTYVHNFLLQLVPMRARNYRIQWYTGRIQWCSVSLGHSTEKSTGAEFRENQNRHDHLVFQLHQERGITKLDLQEGTKEDLQDNVRLLQRQVAQLQSKISDQDQHRKSLEAHIERYEELTDRQVEDKLR